VSAETTWVLEDLLREMSLRGASDLILTVGAPPQLRIHGMLQPHGDVHLDHSATESLARQVLNKEQWTLLQNEKSVDLSRGYEGLSRFRFNVFYQRDSIAMACRIIPFRIPSFEELGLPDVVMDFALKPHGLVLVTGPAGSGKSTTLAAMIDYINDKRRAHVICIEDPIEYLHTHRNSIIEQREILVDTPSFAVALHGVFRQSPDIIMIGEMRDIETMQLALTLAETGHLILATLHTQDTVHAINRIVDVFPPGQQQQIYTQLSMVLSGVISQSLLVTRDMSRRVLACEVMNVSNAIRNLIRERQLQQIYSVIQLGKDEKMVTMNDSLKDLLSRGLIDSATAMDRSPRPKELARLLKISV
jgi:twitching motility protein PilT